jgi:hypothetical protein
MDPQLIEVKRPHPILQIADVTIDWLRPVDLPEQWLSQSTRPERDNPR